jgi:DNA adenine methylase
MLRKYQSDETLFYLDPPYLVEGKSKGIYEIPFTKQDSYELQQRIHETKGMFMVSHYENKLYNKWYEGWNKFQIHAKKQSAKSVNGRKPDVIENIYYNFAKVGEGTTDN